MRLHLQCRTDAVLRRGGLINELLSDNVQVARDDPRFYKGQGRVCGGCRESER